MNIALWILGGFGAIVAVFIGFVVWRIFSTPLGEDQGHQGSSPQSGDALEPRGGLD